MTGKPLHVHILSGSSEYRSDVSMLLLQAVLARQGIVTTLSFGEDGGTAMPGLSALADADVLLVFCRRVTLASGPLRQIQDWCRDGKPVVGIRTASHAFQNWQAFDREILGGNYEGHGRTAAEIRVDVASFAHPLTTALGGWSTSGKLYTNPRVADDATVLLSGNDGCTTQPVAWTRVHPETGGRVFYTALGCLHEFAETRFVTLLVNAIRWCAADGATAVDEPRYWVAQLDAIDPARCPCGFSRRAFVRPDNPLATLHMVDIAADSVVHYHKKLTEIYLVLEGEGAMELDGARVPVKPLTAVFIRPGCRHRAVGRMRIVNIPIPAFDPSDEWFD